MRDVSGGARKLVPVLRTVPKTSGVGRAAITALLAGPSDAEMAADPDIRTAIPAGTELLGITVADGLATVDLSQPFAASGTKYSIQARLAQVVHTVTQFPTVDRVRFQIAGEPLVGFPDAGIVMVRPVTRATYRDALLPDIFVDLPAWGSTLPTRTRVRGLANVFEGQFRLALLDANRRRIVDAPIHATCGSGCWGTFDLTLSYAVSKSQWGTLRVWDPSERDGSPQSVREYPVYLKGSS